ncbi:MAG TPA: ROK family transcriptional regulator [Anaerolineales bacterium]|nr:ROK family transcriptional regulator [Anaerolineales bacterium]
MQHPTGNRDLIRAINRSHILNVIKTHGPIGRADIARRTGLSPATITSISAKLISQDLVVEKSAGDSSGGRPPILLVINPKGGYVVGIKLTETHAICALTDLEALVIAKSSMPLSGHYPEEVVNDLAQMILSFIREQKIPKKQLLGVGVGLAGIVDAEEGILRQSPIYGWDNVPLRTMLQSKLHIPVYIENDVNTLTLTEKWFGHGQDMDNFLTVTVGRGVGLGIVANGQFYRGQTGGAGEFGHTTMNPDGPLCACGKRGCLEAFVGDPGLIRAAQEAADRGEISVRVKDVDELLSLAQTGEAVAIRIFDRAGRILGIGIANLINLFNPKKIIISGEGTREGDFLFIPMKESIQQNTMPGLFDPNTVEIAPWGDDAWARGAAGLVLREVFESPIHKKVSTPVFA